MTPFSSQRYFIYICHLLQDKNNTISSISLKHFATFAKKLPSKISLNFLQKYPLFSLENFPKTYPSIFLKNIL